MAHVTEIDIFNIRQNLKDDLKHYLHEYFHPRLSVGWFVSREDLRKLFGVQAIINYDENEWYLDFSNWRKNSTGLNDKNHFS